MSTPRPASPATRSAGAPEPGIETPRLRLRPLASTDLDALVALDADPAVRRHVDQPEAPTREEVLAGLPRLLERNPEDDTPDFWAVEERETGAFIGWIHLRPLEGHPGALDLGYRLRRGAWGRGYASEGAGALVERAVRAGGVERIVAHALEANVASRRVLEKLGLVERARYLHRGALPAVAYERVVGQQDPPPEPTAA